MRQQAKKWRFKKLLILLIFYFHLEAHVKNGLWGKYQHRLWRNSNQGGLNLILSFLAFNILFFLSTPTLKGKLGIFVMTTTFLDEVGLRPSWVCNFMSWSILSSELWCETVCQNVTTSKKVTIFKVVDFAKILLPSRSSRQEWAMRWISTSSVKKWQPGRIKLNFEFFSIQYFIFSFYADFKRKTRYFCHDNSIFRWSGNQAIMSLQFHVLINLKFRVVVWNSLSKCDNKQKSDNFQSCWFC